MLTKQENEYITQTGPGTPMGTLMRRFWTPVIMSTELPSPDCPPVRVRLMSEDLVAFRDSGGNIGLIDAHCPHRLADMFFGRNEECGLRCVYHGWKFDVNGECVDMPNEPAESNFKSKIRTTAYPCREAGGLIWAYMGPPEQMPTMPELEWSIVPESHRYMAKMIVESNYLQAVEGDIDNSHASFLHANLGPGSTFAERLKSGGGIRGALRVAPDRLKYSELFAKDTSPKGIVKEMDYGIMMGWRRNADDENYYWRINHWLMPYHVNLAAPVGNTMQCNVRVPLDDENSWFFRVRWNPGRPLNEAELAEFKFGGVGFPEMIPGTFRPKDNKDNDYNIDRSLQRSYSVSGIKSVPQQDRAVSESMGLIVDRSKEHLGTSDVVIIAMRRRLLKAARDLEAGIEPVAVQSPATYRIRGVDTIIRRDTPFDVGARAIMEVPA